MVGSGAGGGRLAAGSAERIYSYLVGREVVRRDELTERRGDTVGEGLRRLTGGVGQLLFLCPCSSCR